MEQAEFELRCGLKAALRPPWRAKGSLRGRYGIDQGESRRLRLSFVLDVSRAFIVNTYSPMDSATTGRHARFRLQHSHQWRPKGLSSIKNGLQVACLERIWEWLVGRLVPHEYATSAPLPSWTDDATMRPR